MFSPEHVANGMLQLISLQDLQLAESFDPATHCVPHTVAPQYAKSPMQPKQGSEYALICSNPAMFVFGGRFDRQSPMQRGYRASVQGGYPVNTPPHLYSALPIEFASADAHDVAQLCSGGGGLVFSVNEARVHGDVIDKLVKAGGMR